MRCLQTVERKREALERRCNRLLCCFQATRQEKPSKQIKPKFPTQIFSALHSTIKVLAK
jgi:hypothetical protein